MQNIRKIIGKRLFSILISLDQFVWSLLTLGGSYPDETISSAMYRFETKGMIVGLIFRPVIDKLFWWDRQHCRKAYLAEIFRRQAPRR